MLGFESREIEATTRAIREGRCNGFPAWTEEEYHRRAGLYYGAPRLPGSFFSPPPVERESVALPAPIQLPTPAPPPTERLDHLGEEA